MEATSAPDAPQSQRIVLIGNDELTAVTQRALGAAGAQVVLLRDPNDREVRRALEEEVAAVVVISRYDHVPLRLGLIVEGVRPGVRLIVTVYDRDVASQLRRAVRNVHVISLADIVVPSLAGPCLDDRLLAVSRSTHAGFMGVRADDGTPQLFPLATPRQGHGGRLRANLGSLLRPFELSARILLAGLLGFLLILVVDTAAVAIVLNQSLVEAFYSATKTIVTVGPNPLIDEGPTWFKVFSAVAMLAALGFTAIFTAGVIDRLIDRRLVAIVGPASIPRTDHVVVVGLGQVGLRLCLLLRELGVPVLAIESNPEAYNVARAKDYAIPVVLGRGDSRYVLRRVALARARALVAVTGDEIENILVVVVALANCEELRTLLRAGSGEVINETRSLFSVGVVRDVYRIGGTLLAAAALGSEANEAFLHEQTVYMITPDGHVEPFEADVEATRSIPDTSGHGAAGLTDPI